MNTMIWPTRHPPPCSVRVSGGWTGQRTVGVLAPTHPHACMLLRLQTIESHAHLIPPPCLCEVLCFPCPLLETSQTVPTIICVHNPTMTIPSRPPLSKHWLLWCGVGGRAVRNLHIHLLRTQPSNRSSSPSICPLSPLLMASWRWPNSVCCWLETFETSRHAAQHTPILRCPTVLLWACTGGCVKGSGYRGTPLLLSPFKKCHGAEPAPHSLFHHPCCR